MAKKNASNRTHRSVMGFAYYYSYFMACYFAGLFRRAMPLNLSNT